MAETCKNAGMLAKSVDKHPVDTSGTDPGTINEGLEKPEIFSCFPFDFLTSGTLSYAQP
jgi:hypothetical protein